MPHILRPTSLAALAALAALASACVTAHPAPNAPASAPAPLVTDRPDFTESPLVVPARAVQVEMGHTFTREHGASENTLGEVLVRVGLHERAELRVEGNSIVVASDHGVRTTGREDAGIGAKLSLIPELEGRHLLPTTALLVGTSLATGSREQRSSALTPEAKLALSWSLAEGWALSSNANVASIPASGTRTREYVGSLSLGHDLGERVGMYTEVYGGRTSLGESSRFANAGLTFAAGPLFQLDVRLGAGFGPSRGNRFVGAGLARRW